MKAINVISVGVYTRLQKQEVSQKAMHLIDEGLPNVHVEILWSHDGQPVIAGFFASSYELDDEIETLPGGHTLACLTEYLDSADPKCPCQKEL